MDRKQIAKKIGKSDIFILLSKDEGFGMVVIESMLSGVPVILSNSGGFKDIVNNNINGILVEHGDINQSILSIEKLIKNNTFRNKIVKNALKDAKKYRRDNIAKQFIEIIKFLSLGENIN
jgi:glycosyltransferase involved in cell wall biosynthesis